MSAFSPFSKEELIPQTEMLEIKKTKREVIYRAPQRNSF